MHELQYPLAFGHWHLQRGTLVCRMPRSTLTVSAPGALLAAVLRLCDGRLAWKQVAAELAGQWERRSVEGFLADLARHGALVEAGEALAEWWVLGEDGPGRLGQGGAGALDIPASPRPAGEAKYRSGLDVPAGPAGLARLLQQAVGAPTFGDEAIASQALGAIVRSAAGAIPPGCELRSASHVRWLVFVLRRLGPAGPGGGDAFDPGLYEAVPGADGGSAFRRFDAPAASAWHALADPRTLTFASALIVPLFDVSEPARALGNQAAPAIAVHAGAWLCNAQRMAALVGAAACLRSDILARAVLQQVERIVGASTRPRWLVPAGLVVGARPRAEHIRQQWSASRMEVGRLPLLRCATGAVAAQEGFAFHAGPVMNGERRVHASGRAMDPRLAVRKAEAEAWERRGWLTLGPASEGTARDFPGTVDPAMIVAYPRERYRSPDFPFQRFAPDRRYLWREGTQLATGRPCWVPAECVHALGALPVAFQRGALTSTSTSGVAAWADAEGALCRATLELLERDAFLRAWLSKAAPPRIVHGSLPAALHGKVRALEAAGHRVAISELSGELVPVFSVFVQGRARPFTAITAAADFDAEAALEKALTEAEGRAAHSQAFPAEPLSCARDVRSVADINRFYQTRRFFRRSDFYAAAAPSRAFGSRGARCAPHWDELKSSLLARALQLIAVDLTPRGAAVEQGRVPLHVVRAIVPGLLPIWFQSGLQPAAASALHPRGRDRLSSSAFIHPFT